MVIFVKSVVFRIDTCDLSWQSSRDDLIVSAHFFSDLSIVTILAAAIMTFISSRGSCKFVPKVK